MSIPASDWRVHAAEDYAQRRADLVKKRDQAVARAMRARSRAGELEAEITALDNGARAFGLAVIEQPRAIIGDKPLGHGASPGVAAGGSSPPQSGQFKDVALEVLEAAYPGPLKAAEVQERVQTQLGRQFHWKTAGMTLFRLKGDYKVRRVGHDWFFVPPDERAEYEATERRREELIKSAAPILYPSKPEDDEVDMFG